MLHALTSIDWARLTHAQGPADDLPSLLRSIERGDSFERVEACRELLALLCPDGRTFDSTALAVPFLYELLGCVPASQDREGLLHLLATIARASASDEAGLEAVGRGLDSIFPLLRDPHPRVRLHASLLCASVPTRPGLVQALGKALEWERALDAQVGLALSLAVHGTFAAEVFETDDDDLPLERLEKVARRAATGQQRPQIVELLAALAAEGLDEELLDALER